MPYSFGDKKKLLINENNSKKYAHNVLLTPICHFYSRKNLLICDMIKTSSMLFSLRDYKMLFSQYLLNDNNSQNAMPNVLQIICPNSCSLSFKKINF